MKAIGEFKQFYRGTLGPRLKKLDAKRKDALKTEFRALAAIVGSNLLLYFIIRTIYIDKLWVCLVTGIAGIIAFYLIHRNNYNPYYSEFKSSVIGGIISFIDDNLGYYPENCISEEEFEYSNIFNQTPDRYNGSDYVRGTVGLTAIRFSQVHAEYMTETTETDEDGHTHTEEHWHTIFQGIFFVADFYKDFRTQTLVWPDTSMQTLGTAAGSFWRSLAKRGSLFGGGWQTIKLEDPEFEKYFIVYGSDQIESRYVLSTSLIRRILEFRKRVGANIYISFLGSKIYVAIPCATLFEPKYFRTILDYNLAQTYFSYLDLTIGIVEDFNLNTRIWSKQPVGVD